MNVQIPVWETIGVAWQKTKGAKSTVWAAVFVIVLITIGINIFLSIVKSLTPGAFPITKIILQIILVITHAGLIYIGIQRAKDMPISFDLIFYPFKDFLWLKIFGFYLLQAIIFLIIGSIGFLAYYISSKLSFPFHNLIAFLLNVFTAILFAFFLVRMSLALAFTLDQGLFPWTAIQHSFKVTAENFWRLVALLIIQTVTLIISLIPLLIGLIWTVPFLIICYGVIYKRLLPNA